MNPARRLLNTEKLIFKTNDFSDDQSKYYVMLTVEPEGFVAILHVPESQEIMYNIVCDELLLGIPHKAWWVAVLVLLCLGLALLIPHFLPSYLLSKGSPEVLNQNVSKEH
uniref:Uncharacterized protein LOC107262298 n=1 Tax=Rhizophora mucronata TaxID=61149 RepID=A0A2P2N9U7_RHIMU